MILMIISSFMFLEDMQTETKSLSLLCSSYLGYMLQCSSLTAGLVLQITSGGLTGLYVIFYPLYHHLDPPNY